MPKKPKLDTKQMFDLICDFAQNMANPDRYSESDKPEDEMQIHFSEFMSHHYEVLREVNVPALNPNCGCGTEHWEIDETLRVKGMNGATFYVTGELKLHASKMCNTRNYVDEVVADVTKMYYVSRLYTNVPMGFVFFVTCDDEECQSVINEIEKMSCVTDHVTKKNDKYSAIIIRIIPQNNEASYDYSSHWHNREEYLRSNNNLKEYYFPRKLK